METYLTELPCLEMIHMLFVSKIDIDTITSSPPVINTVVVVVVIVMNLMRGKAVHRSAQ